MALAFQWMIYFRRISRYIGTHFSAENRTISTREGILFGTGKRLNLKAVKKLKKSRECQGDMTIYG